jgi:hypothetical protein
LRCESAQFVRDSLVGEFETAQSAVWKAHHLGMWVQK